MRVIFARHGLCEVVRPVAAVSSPHEGSSPTGVSADGGWVVEDAGAGYWVVERGWRPGDVSADGGWVVYGGGWEDAGYWVVERGWRPGDVSTRHQSAHHSPSHDLTTDQNICPVF